MRYIVRLAGRELGLEVRGSEVRIGGRVLAASLEQVPGTPVYQLRCGARSETLVLVRQPEGWLVQRGGEVWVAEVRDERSQLVSSLKAAAPRGEGAGLVRAPMPGLVLRVEVEVGQPVAPGSGLVVLEAMKMENEIRAPGPGRVKAVLVKAGETVEKGSPLVELGAEG